MRPPFIKSALVVSFMYLLVSCGMKPANDFYFTEPEQAQEPMSFSVNDSSKFAFQIKRDAADGNDVFYWGWNPPWANYDSRYHSAAFSLERNYKDDIEWNFDVRGSNNPDLGMNRSRPIHAMINARTGYPKSLDFEFAAVNFSEGIVDKERQTSEPKVYTMLTKEGATFFKGASVYRGLYVDGPMVLSNEGATLESPSSNLVINWLVTSIHSYDLTRVDSCYVTFRSSKIGQTITVVFNTSKPMALIWDKSPEGLEIYWPDGKELRKIGTHSDVTSVTFTRLKLHGVKEIFLARDVAEYGAAK